MTPPRSRLRRRTGTLLTVLAAVSGLAVLLATPACLGLALDPGRHAPAVRALLVLAPLAGAGLVAALVWLRRLVGRGHLVPAATPWAVAALAVLPAVGDLPVGLATCACGAALGWCGAREDLARDGGLRWRGFALARALVLFGGLALAVLLGLGPDGHVSLSLGLPLAAPAAAAVRLWLWNRHLGAGQPAGEPRP